MTGHLHKRFEILHVEDNDLDAEAVARGLRRLGFDGRLDRATDGLCALEMLRAEQRGEAPTGIRIVLLDINMPRMNGHEFLEALRADPALRSVPVFVLSTSDAISDVKRAHGMNANGYVVKPAGGSNLSATLEALCGFLNVCAFPPRYVN